MLVRAVGNARALVCYCTSSKVDMVSRHAAQSCFLNARPLVQVSAVDAHRHLVVMSDLFEQELCSHTFYRVPLSRPDSMTTLDPLVHLEALFVIARNRCLNVFDTKPSETWQFQQLFD